MGKEKKPKKGGMVIVIGVGAKPKKKDQMKKAEDDAPKAEDDAPKRERRGRGGKRSTTRRFHNRVNTGRINLEEIFDKRKIDPEEFHGEFRRRTGQDFDEYISSGKDEFDIQEMIDDIASKAAEARGGQREQRNQDRQRQIFDGLMKTPEKTLRRMGIKVEDWQRAVTQRNREGNLTGDTFDELKSKLGDKKKIAEMAEKRTAMSREKGQEAQAKFTEGGGYHGLPDDVFDRTPDMGDVEQERHLATRGDEPDNEHEQNQEYERMKRLLSALNVQYGPDVVDAMARRYATEGRTGAPTSQAAVDHHGFATGGQGRGGGSSVSHLPSTVFTKPKAAANTRMSSPQEEEFEGVTFDPRAKGIDGGGSRQHQEFIMRALQSDLVNPMESAFALLKGNPAMRDTQGRAINHPAAMVYDDLAAQVDMNELDNDAFGEEVSDRMEQMREPTHQKKVMQRLKQGKPASFLDAKMATRNDQAEKNRLNRYRQTARERTSQMMDEPDQAAGPNYGVQQSTGTDVKMKEGNIMDQM